MLVRNKLANSYASKYFGNQIRIKFLRIIPFHNYNIATLPKKKECISTFNFMAKIRQSQKTKMYDCNKARLYFHSLRV